ncbi:MAG: RNA polymerase sigma factor [Blastocatellales bacterium]
MHDADSVLLALIEATNELEERRLRDELLLEYAAPVIRQTLRQRLRLHSGYSGPHPPDAEDLFNDVIVKLIEKLSELRANPEKHGIRNFSLYVARVTANACNDYLRNRKQERHRLKHKLRNLLDRHPDFRVWKGENNTILCGLSVWENQGSALIESISSQPTEELVERLRIVTFARKHPGDLPLSKIAAEALKLTGQTVELNQLVEIVADFQGIRDRLPESLDAVESGLSRSLTDAAPQSDSLIEGRESLRLYWEEVKKLPADQRNTICLSFEDESGEDLFSLLVDAGIATLPELAAEFGLPSEQFGKLWVRVPMMDNTELAEYLGATRQQVSLWRFRAQSRLRKWLTERKNKIQP